MKQLDNWQIDEAWVNHVLFRAKQYDVISFDIFDTALTRIFDSPVDIFAEVERKQLIVGKEHLEGFGNLRELAESKARANQFILRRAEDISINEIYEELAKLNKQFIDWDDVQQCELNTERDALFSVPDIIELIRQLKLMNKKIIFVSDMYLPSDFLRAVLCSCGYEDWDELIVSNEVNATKASGNMWPLLKQKYPGPMLHIGDDEWSDVKSPESHGVDAIPFLRVRTERRTAGSLKPNQVAFSQASRRLILRRQGLINSNPSENAIYEDLGRTYGALIVGSFLQWLIARLKLHDVKHLYFCSRDGYLLLNTWNKLELSKVSGLNASYLEVARRPLNLASGYIESTSQHLDDRLVNFLCSTGSTTTLEIILKRIGLLDDKQIVKKVLDNFGSLDAKILTRKDYDLIANIFKSSSGAIYKKLQNEYDNLYAYLMQEGLLTDRKAAIVDMGWHGTIQRSLQKIINSQGAGKHKIIGFYYGLWPKALENSYVNGLMETAFGSMFLKEEQQPELYESVAILEELHSAPHGTVIGYTRDTTGQIKAVTADNPLEEQQFKEITKYFQHGVIDELFAIYSGESSTGLKIEDLTIENATCALGAIALSPSMNELNALSKIKHCTGFDHQNFLPIISKPVPETREMMYEKYWSSAWRIGTLRSWLQNATSEQRRTISEIATNHMPYQHERTKRIFL